MINKTMGFIGVGNMGAAMIEGIIKSQIIQDKSIGIYDKNPKASEKICEKYNVNVCTSIDEAVDADIIFLCVKPNIIYSVIEEIKDKISEGSVIVSIAAGQSIEKLEKAFGRKNIRLIRVMPNTPALVGEGMSAISLNSEMKKEEYKEEVSEIKDIFEAFGKAEIVAENLMDAVTGVSGSSPAYIFILIEAMADAAVLGGMSRDIAYKFAAQSVLGSAKMVLESDIHPAKLKDMVCSPSGTTIEAVKALEEGNFRGTVINAIQKCIEKSKKM